jgi:hypothetical protein
LVTTGGRAPEGLGGPKALPNPTELRMPVSVDGQTDCGC